jgi:hypothetical protein
MTVLKSCRFLQSSLLEFAHMPSRIFTTLTVILGFSAMGLGQQAACKDVEIPIGVISASGDIFRGLAAEDFIGHLQKRPVTVKLVTFDDGPRRVLIVVDANKKLPSDSRKAQGEMLRTILDNARPQDTFALISTRGHGPQMKFTADRSAIKLALASENGPENGKEKELGVLDGVMTGMEWFGNPQSGDSIVVMAADMEGNHKTNAKLVARALEEKHIRLFGLALGPVTTKNSVAGETVTNASMGLAYSRPVVGDVTYTTGDDNFFPLTVNSGGLVLGVVNGDSYHNYHLEDPQVLQAVRQKALSISKMISAYYRMQVEPPQLAHPQDWNLAINPEVQKHAPPMFVLYPHQLGPC